jgi:hypothetical protein
MIQIGKEKRKTNNAATLGAVVQQSLAERA